MKINYKIIGLVMFVMLICCLSAASATDVDNITVPDDTGIADVDVPVDSVDEVENEAISDDDSSENAVGQENLRGQANINNDVNIGNYFDSTTGVLLSNAGNNFVFDGDFYNTNFNYNTFVVNRAVTIDATTANFYNMGFDLTGSNITLVGGTYYADDSVATNSVIEVTGDYASVTDTVIDVYAPEDQDFIAIDVANSNGTLIYGNVITYECGYENLNNTNYVIRAKNSPNVNISVNEITSILPFKNVDYYTRQGMDMDLAAAVGIEESDNFYLYFNVLQGYIETTCTGYPTLDMVIICDSDNGYIGWNSIDEIDYITQPDNPSYLYAIDLYRCDNLTVEFNEINLTSKGGTYIPGTNNGTSAAYGIQLTGGYSGVLIKGNTITTANNGPNAGIYSQNFAGPTSLQIINNTITVEGNASLHSWSLVTGMELQDDEVNISGNTITVINKGNYETGHNAYGISFSQYYIRLPTSFVVENNTIELVNGHYTVYIQDDVYASVTNNCLTSMDACGNATVYDNGHIVIADNYCPQCDGVNCTCIH